MSCKETSYNNVIKKSLKDIIECSYDCKRILSSYNIKICNNFIIKLSDCNSNSTLDEYNNYLSVYQNDNLRHLIYVMPLYFKDDIGDALVFDNTDKIYTLGNMINTMSYKELIYSLTLLVNEMELFMKNGFYHGDLHTNNILYKDKKIYFIDFETLTITNAIDESDRNISYFMMKLDFYKNLLTLNEQNIRLQLDYA